MIRAVLLLCGMACTASTLAAQAPASAPLDGAFYMVAYVEVSPAGRAAGTAALRTYRDESRGGDGCIRVELLEQIDRPGQFVIVEMWRDQKAFDAGAAAARARLLDSLKPVRQSGWDERPYKALTVAAPIPDRQNAIAVVTHVDVSMDPKVPPLLRGLTEASRREPGNVRFDVLQHAVRANHFTILETWLDAQAHEAHRAAAHTRQFRDDVQPMTGSPLDVRLFRTVD